MNRSTAERDAKEFLVAQIADEASRRGVSLSEVERKMLFFSETDWTLPDISEVAEAFNRDYEEGPYEQKIASLIRSARKRTDHSQAAWRRAERCLARGDHYLSVMLDQATDQQGDDLSWGDLRVIVTILTGFILFQVALARYLGHLPSKEESGFFVWLIAVGLASVYLVIRVFFGKRAVERFMAALMWPFFGGRK